MATFDLDPGGLAWAGWAFGLPLLLGGCGYALFAYALARNPVALLDFADRLLRGWKRPARLATTIRFGSDPAQRLILYTPTAPRSDAPLALVLFIHGGAWVSGTPADYAFIARTLAGEGVAVALGGYRLVPGGRFPAMLEDGAAALRWLVDNAKAHGLDPARITLMGHSAGGYNALMLALDPRWLAGQGLAPAMLRGTVAMSAPTSFLPLDDPATRAAFGHLGDLAQTQPVNHASGDAPPLLLLHGAEDRRVRPRNAHALANALARAGAAHRAVVLEGLNHEDPLKLLARPFARDRRVLAAIAAFLAEVNAPGAVATASSTVQRAAC